MHPEQIVLSVVAPVFGLIGLGNLIRRVGILEGERLKGLTDLVYWVVLPAYLFGSILRQEGGSLAAPATYFAVAFTVFGLSLVLARLALRARLAQAAVFALNAVFGNVALLGIPIVAAMWGEPGVAVLLAILAFHSVSLLPVCTALIEIDRGAGAGLGRVLLRTVTAILVNPIIVAILAAYVWRGIGLPRPEAVMRFLGLIGQATPALSLICLGASLPALTSAAVWKEAGLAAAVKLAVMPLAMAVAARWAGLPPLEAAVMVAVAATPTGANAFMLARNAGALMEASAATVVIGTVAAVATLSVVLILVQ